jgi:hypothetical protein
MTRTRLRPQETGRTRPRASCATLSPGMFWGWERAEPGRYVDRDRSRIDRAGRSGLKAGTEDRNGASQEPLGRVPVPSPRT